MSPLGALLGLVSGIGALLVVAFAWNRRPLTMVERIGPYVTVPVSSRRDSRRRPSLAELVYQLVPARRPKRRSEGVDVDRFDRLHWTAVGGLIGTSIGAMMAVGSDSVVAIAILGMVGAATGRFARDQTLAIESRRRTRLIDAQMPATVELVALAVTAGEPIVSALERVGSATPAPLGDELTVAIADVRAGASVELALAGLARRCACRSVERFVDGLVVAIERGTPLASILRAQAEDARAEGRRRLVESAGRKDALMLVPVVFLVLPTVVAVAMFPGIQTLRLVVP